jgi:hypothetical protein
MAKLPVAEGYEEFLGELKERIKQAPVRAVLAVNRELILLYWQIRARYPFATAAARLGSKGD